MLLSFYTNVVLPKWGPARQSPFFLLLVQQDHPKGCGVARDTDPQGERRGLDHTLFMSFVESSQCWAHSCACVLSRSVMSDSL